MIEDDANAALLICTLLQRHGFDTFTTDNAVDALIVLENQEGITLIILDILLPGLSGVNILEILHKDYPQVAVLIVSAHIDSDLAALAAVGETPRLRKPFSKEQFDEAISQLGVL
mgnify:CR=1 FL=1